MSDRLSYREIISIGKLSPFRKDEKESNEILKHKFKDRCGEQTTRELADADWLMPECRAGAELSM